MYTQGARELSATESGVGAHLAKSWETSIRQALMPVLSNNTSKTILILVLSNWMIKNKI